MVVYLLIPQIGKFPEAWQSIRHAEPVWLAVAVVATAGIFVAGGVQLTGATSLPVPALRAAAAQLAAAFAAKLTPAGVGAVGVRVRFLQRSGLDTTGAVGSATLWSVAGGIVHIAWFVIAIVIAGSNSSDDDVSLPDGWILLAGAVLVLSTIGVVVFLPRARAWLHDRARPALADLAHVLRRPAKAARLFGGAIGQTGCALIAFGACLEAVGAGTGIGTMMVVYLGGTTVAAAAPTPGGLGATEAALVAGLTATGTPTDLAVAGVLVFRTFTYWGELFAGWIAVHTLRRRALLCARFSERPSSGERFPGAGLLPELPHLAARFVERVEALLEPAQAVVGRVERRRGDVDGDGLYPLRELLALHDPPLELEQRLLAPLPDGSFDAVTSSRSIVRASSSRSSASDFRCSTGAPPAPMRATVRRVSSTERWMRRCSSAASLWPVDHPRGTPRWRRWSRQATSPPPTATRPSSSATSTGEGVQPVSALRVIPARSPRVRNFVAILRLASSIISSPNITAPLRSPGRPRWWPSRRPRGCRRPCRTAPAWA